MCIIGELLYFVVFAKLTTYFSAFLVFISCSLLFKTKKWLIFSWWGSRGGLPQSTMTTLNKKNITIKVVPFINIIKVLPSSTLLSPISRPIREGRGMVVGFRGWPAPVHHDDPQQEEHHHQSSSLLYPCIAYISATLRDIDTKISGCIQIPKEHSLLHSYPHGQLHHRLHQHHQSASLLLPCIPYISANNRDIATKLSG